MPFKLFSDSLVHLSPDVAVNVKLYACLTIDCHLLLTILKKCWQISIGLFSIQNLFLVDRRVSHGTESVPRPDSIVSYPFSLCHLLQTAHEAPHLLIARKHYSTRYHLLAHLYEVDLCYRCIYLIASAKSSGCKCLEFGCQERNPRCLMKSSGSLLYIR